MNAFVGISRCCISLVDWMFDSMNLFRIGFAFEILIEFVSLWSFLSSVTSKLFRCSDEYLVSKRYFLYERFCRFTVACHKCNFRIEKELRALHLHQTQTKHSKYWHRHQQATVAPSYAQFECKYSRHGLVSTSIRRLERKADGSSSQRRHNIFCAAPFGSSFNLYRYFAFGMNSSDTWVGWAWCDFYFLLLSLET